MLTRPDDKEHQGVASQVKELIVCRGYAPGDRLPPERELIGQFGVSRGTLRRALDTFRIDGLKTTLPLFRALAADSGIQAGEANTAYLEAWLETHSIDPA